MTTPTTQAPAKRDRLSLTPRRQAVIRATRATVTDGVYLVETMDSEMYTVTRYPELDNDIRRAWKQVQP